MSHRERHGLLVAAKEESQQAPVRKADATHRLKLIEGISRAFSPLDEIGRFAQVAESPEDAVVLAQATYAALFPMGNDKASHGWNTLIRSLPNPELKVAAQQLLIEEVTQRANLVAAGEREQPGLHRALMFLLGSLDHLKPHTLSLKGSDRLFSLTTDGSSALIHGAKTVVSTWLRTSKRSFAKGELVRKGESFGALLQTLPKQHRAPALVSLLRETRLADINIPTVGGFAFAAASTFELDACTKPLLELAAACSAQPETAELITTIVAQRALASITPTELEEIQTNSPHLVLPLLTAILKGCGFAQGSPPHQGLLRSLSEGQHWLDFTESLEKNAADERVQTYAGAAANELRYLREERANGGLF